jgi:hypothetical protein
MADKIDRPNETVQDSPESIMKNVKNQSLIRKVSILAKHVSI